MARIVRTFRSFAVHMAVRINPDRGVRMDQLWMCTRLQFAFTVTYHYFPATHHGPGALAGHSEDARIRTGE